MPEAIVRIAARGDGVTAGGKHVPGAVPGDSVDSDGLIRPGPQRQDPPCRHFPQCGGCQLQHVADPAFSAYLVDRVAGALAQHGLETTIREPHLSPPCSRRRASLRVIRTATGIVIGFNAERSNRVVDMRECHVLRAEIFALVAPLRHLLSGLVAPKRTAEVQLTLLDQGVDCLLKGVEPDGLAAIEALNRFAADQRLARLSIDQGLGPETLIEPGLVTITLGGVPVPFPHGAFLQATADGEAALVHSVAEAVGEADRIVDLFCGLGTFALALGARCHAVEASRDAILALQRAAPAMRAEHRDLYRRPLEKDELARFEAVVLDPPRAGAAEQVGRLAGSTVARIAYVSCNPATFARDARLLVDGGYRLDWVRPVGQFRWSTHVELAAAFRR